MINFVASEVPAPGVLIVSDQRLKSDVTIALCYVILDTTHLIADRVKGRLLRGHAHHRVRASLARGPAQLEHVEPALVPDLNTLHVQGIECR